MKYERKLVHDGRMQLNKKAAEEKLQLCKKMLWGNVLVEVSERQKRKYRESMTMVKKVESKERVGDELGRKILVQYLGNKRLVWKEAKIINGERIQ